MIGSARANRFGSAAMKKKWTRAVSKAAGEHGIERITYPVDVECVWVEGDKRRDLDNVAAGIKFVLDGLVDGGFMIDDSQKWVKRLTHTISRSPDKSYGVRVTLTSCSDRP
jgi:Holliday junction resolvase RusA-like endonuclease